MTDLDSDGRAELTSETLRTSLTRDDHGVWAKTAHDSVHMPVDAKNVPEGGYREFGDFNGDGTEDMLRLVESDPSRPGALTAQIFWNTGNGFYPDGHVRTIALDAHPDTAISLPTRFADPGIHVTDVDNDGRMDVVTFNNDPLASNGPPSPRIVFLFSVGDGTFTEVDLPVAKGTRDDVKYAFDNGLRPITFYPGRLEHDQARIALQAVGQVFPPALILLQAVPYEDYIVVGSDAKTPGLAAGWNLSTLADANGDGFIDVIRHVGGNDALGGFEVIEQTPKYGDELVSVKDAPTAWPALSIAYSSEWSDRPEVNDSYTCAYPLTCPKTGLRVVREVTSRAGLTDVAIGEDPLALGHSWEYAYRDPVANRQGQGFFGFSEMRVWDAAIEHPVETITTFDLRTTDPSGRIYPGVGVPATVTVAQPILNPGAGKPASADTRVTKSTYTYELRTLNGGATHALFPQSTHASQWEQSAAISWSGTGPDHLHVAGYVEPAAPPIHVDTQVTVDDFGNTTDTVSETVKGLATEIKTPRFNDTVNWHLGLTDSRTEKTLEAAKGAAAVWQTTAYTWSSYGDLDTIVVEPNSADPALQSTMSFGWDDYGLLASVTAQTPGETSRTQRIDYATAWPGAPDEHLFASTSWSDHDNPLCVLDCRPATFALTQPAYGLAVAVMDVNGVQTLATHDGHGRTTHTETDGSLPVEYTYAGRADAFGGMNGLQATATSGLQKVMKTYDGRGAVLRTSFVGFDGQWINAFATHDALGRMIGMSRPNAGVPLAWTTYDHDSLGRTVATHAPDGSVSKTSYALLSADSVDPSGHASHREYDVNGRVVESRVTLPPQPGCAGCVADGVQTTFSWSTNATGATATAIDDQGHAVTTQYDRLDRAISQDDPSAGATHVSYNGFGETKSTLHVASGELETNTYDDLGRIETSTGPTGLTSYTWDVALNGIGRLARAMSPDQIRTDYRYDALGRTTGIDQIDETLASLSLDFGFDAQTGRLATIDYPQAPGQPSRLRAAYAWNGYGYLTSITDATPGHVDTKWQEITARNADLALVDAVRGIEAGVGGAAVADHRDYDPVMGRVWNITAKHVSTDLLALGYNYDADGLVNERLATNPDFQIDEVFAYDALHRLTSTTRKGIPLQSGLPFATAIDETYDTVGNRIDTRSNGFLIEHRSYGKNGQQPYSLTERAISDGFKPNAPPVIEKYSYDALGRLEQDPRREIHWTPFNLPASITENGEIWTFAYDAEHVRVRKNGPTEKITSFGGLYEKHESDNTRRHVFHIIGGDAPVGDVTYVEAAQPTQPGTTTVSYVLADALGTTVGVTDDKGTLAELDYYDLWGRRTQADGTAFDKPGLFESLVGAGFTSQHHDDDIALIDMQGRLYDSALGRFLSADPLVANPLSGQSWNAYGYVGNNPVNFTDPSGFECTGTTTVSADGKSVSSLTACHDDEGAPTGGIDGAIRWLQGYGPMMEDLARIAKQRQAVEQARGHFLDGVRIQAPDGTPLPTRRVDTQRAVVTDNWGKPLHPLRAQNPKLNVTNHPAAKHVGRFARKLFCGHDCSSASAPGSATEVAQAPNQLSDGKLVRNAVSQAIAYRSLRRWIGKVGVVIDDGVDGVIERLTPPELKMAQDPDAPKKPPAMSMSVDPEDEEMYKLSLEEEVEEARKSLVDAKDTYAKWQTLADKLKSAGVDADWHGRPLWLMEQHAREWAKEVGERTKLLEEAEARLNEKP